MKEIMNTQSFCYLQEIRRSVVGDIVSGKLFLEEAMKKYRIPNCRPIL